MSTNIVPILVPTGELSDSFVVGMLRLFQSTNNHFVGDLLARHAPKSTDFYSRVIRANAPMIREQPRIERCYMFEMLGFTKGLMQALMDESIGMSTAWGRTQPQLSDAVNTYMERNSQNWQCDGTGSPDQREFYDEVMDPFLHRVNAYWDVKIRKHPNLMWFGTLTREGDLIIEAGEDFRVADPAALVRKQEAPAFLDPSFGEAIDQCDRRFVALRRHTAGVGQSRISQDPFEFLYERKGGKRLLPLGGHLKPLAMPEKSSQSEVFQRILDARENPNIRLDDGIIAIRVAQDDVVDDSPKADPNRTSIPDVPVTLAEIISQSSDPWALIRAQNAVTEHEAEQRLMRENPLNSVPEVRVGRADRRFVTNRVQKKPDNKSES